MATVAEVARQAGVAPSTVSHALSGKRPIAAATRERIITAARELGYEPNATTGTVRARRTRTVGLSLPLASPGRTLSHGPFAEYVADIADLLAAHDYKLLCLLEPAHRSQNHAARGEGGPQAWREKGGQQRTVPRPASGCHGLSSRHHR